MKLTALALVILALGIILGLALRDTVFEAEAAKPTPTGRLIELGTFPSDDGPAVFPLVKTDDCSQMTAVATGPVNENLSLGTTSLLSLDGTTLINFRPHAVSLDGNSTTATLGPAPFIQLRVFTSGSSTNIVDVTAWLWCAP